MRWGRVRVPEEWFEMTSSPFRGRKNNSHSNTHTLCMLQLAQLLLSLTLADCLLCCLLALNHHYMHNITCITSHAYIHVTLVTLDSTHTTETTITEHYDLVAEQGIPTWYQVK